MVSKFTLFVSLILWFFAAVPVARVFAQTQTHPFLLVRPDQLNTLASRSSQEPWAGMKSRAVAECTQRVMSEAPDGTCNGSLSTTTYPSLNSYSFCMRAIMSSCALAAITDPANKATYLDKITATLPSWEKIITIQSGADDGTRNTSDSYYTDATAAYFNSVLAIDILHTDLSSRSRPGDTVHPTWLSYAEFLMEQEYNHFYGISKPVYNFVLRDGSTLSYPMPSRHPPAQEAVLILWKIYTNTFTTSDPDSHTLLNGGTLSGESLPFEGYLSELAARVNPSGVYTEGSSYAHAGWGLDRDERSHLFDVLEFTGKDAEFGLDFYTNPRYQAFYEWLYGYASTPFGVMTSFGDTYAYRQLTDSGHGQNSWASSSHIGQAGKFSALAGGYALWKSRGQPQQGRLLNYLLLDPTAVATSPPSRIFPNGGGFFLEQPANDQGLYGALWNVRPPLEGSPVFHVRKDVNAIYVAGYGSPLLMNGGFCGSSSPAGPDSCSGQDENNVQHRFSGTYLGDRAVSNNVGMINYTLGPDYLSPDPDSQTSTFGSGILEGFVGNGLDYASGSTDTALSNGKHDRSFLFAHPTSTSRGYFFVFDEFTNVTQGPVHLVFHPNARTRTVVNNLTEYTLPVGRTLFGDANTGLSLFFATPPQSIAFQRGIIATSGSVGAYVPEFFFNTYPITGNKKQIATVLFPYNSTHPKATMNRISGTNYSGATIDHGAGVIDTTLENSNTAPITVGPISFQGTAAWYRSQSSSVTAYFARKATELRTTSGTLLGFTATQPITLSLKGTTGNIISPGTSVTVYYPGITDIRINNQSAATIAQTPTSRTVTVPAGTHTIQILSGDTTLTPFLSPTTSDTPTPIPTPDADIDNNQIVNWVDYERVIAAFGRQGTPSFVPEDILSNGHVDIYDINILIAQFARTYP